MAADIDTRLKNLNSRRRGTDRLDRLNRDSQNQILADSFVLEPWQRRATSQPFTQYAIGAMEEVDKKYTQISIETAERVGSQLRTNLSAEGFSVSNRLQGSVPLNVHIRGVSDVDLLLLDESFLVYANAGRKAQEGLYWPTEKDSRTVLLQLRQRAEVVLTTKFPAADVNTSGGKAIAISGGSLARPVDVVPSHWYDNVAYQASDQEHERGVQILDKNKLELIENLPFLHIHRVHQRDAEAAGGLKKAIRLCKHVKNDALESGKQFVYPSFDIAATMYHADLEALRRGALVELSILAETQRFLDELYRNKGLAQALWVPDGSRPIFDSEEKYQGLQALSVEMDELLQNVAKEQINISRPDAILNYDDARRIVENSFVPVS